MSAATFLADFETESGDAFVIAGSANLRSSDNCEQVTIFNDPDLVSFYRTWIEDMSTAP